MLHGVPATMLVTVAARALAPQRAPDLQFRDKQSEDILKEIGLSAEDLAGDLKTVRTVAARSRWFDRVTAAFFRRHPNGRGINLGCGLNTSFDRLAGAGGESLRWIDVDLPDVIAIRRRFFRDSDRRRMAEGDITSPDVFAVLDWKPEEPALVLLEGVLYYLKPGDPERLIGNLAAAANARRAPLDLVFDYVSPVLMWRSRRMMKDVSAQGAILRWPLWHPDRLKRIDEKLRVRALHPLSGEIGWPINLMDVLHRALSGGAVGMACAELERMP